MNLGDYLEEGKILEKELLTINQIIFELEECLAMKNKFETETTVFLTYNSISGSGEPYISNSQKIKNLCNNYYTQLKKRLSKINFREYWTLIVKIDDNLKLINVKEFKEALNKDYDIIHLFISEDRSYEEDLKIYPVLISSIEDIVNRYERVRYLINNIKRIYDNLNNNANEKTINLRLLNEDNTIEIVIESLFNVKKIYSSICRLTDVNEDENPLKYSRLESGTFDMNLLGDVGVLVAIGQVISFSYKVYSENFSWKAKQEKELGKIKVRGEYIKLLKEAGLNITTDESVIKECLAELEESNINLYEISSRIKLNGEEIGIKEIQNEKVKKYIEDIKMIDD